MSDSEFQIRLCRPADKAGAYAVCLKTGDSGNDATHLYDDPLALGHIYVGPYLELEPNFAHVLEDDTGVCGYVLGALDSRRFYDRYLGEWLPGIRQEHPDPSGDPVQWTPTQKIYHEYHHPRIYFPPGFTVYPCHAHIDLLPRAQGRGVGRKMMEVLLAKLVAAGSSGVHLGMSPFNTRAESFYHKLGFQELARVGTGECQTLYLGKRLEQGRPNG